MESLHNQKVVKKEINRTGYILFLMDLPICIPFLDYLISEGHSIFGSSLHINLISENQIILTLPLQASSSFLDKCHRFRQRLLARREDPSFPSKVLMVISQNREGENSFEVIERLLKGRVVSADLLESQGLCML